MKLDRAIVLAAVLALHAVLLLVFMTGEQGAHRPEPALVLVSLAITPVSAPEESLQQASPRAAGRTPRHASHTVPPRPGSPAVAVPAPSIPPLPAAPSPPVDWRGAAEAIAAQWADGQGDRDRRAAALTSRYTVITPYKPHPYRIRCFPVLFLILSVDSCGLKDAPSAEYDRVQQYFQDLDQARMSFSETTIEGRVP